MRGCQRSGEDEFLTQAEVGPGILGVAQRFKGGNL